MYGGDRGSRAACRQKSVMFFVRFFVFFLFFFVTLCNYKICDNGSSEIFKTIMVPLHRERFLVVHLYSSFSMEPLDSFLVKNLY